MSWLLPITCAVVITSLATHRAGASYPIGSITIREQAIEAQVIVLAKVDLDLTPPKRQPKLHNGDLDLSSAYIVLKVQEVWKGTPGTPTIRQQNCRTECDAQTYEPGTTVIAFLDGPKADGTFSTRGYEYGYRAVDPAGAAVFKSRIAEFQSAAQIKDENERRTKTVDCLVKCVQNPMTRWDGATDLYPGGQFEPALSKGQREELLITCLSATSFGAGEDALENALANVDDPRLLTWLVAMLRQVARSEDLKWTSAIAYRVNKRDPRPEVDALAGRIIRESFRQTIEERRIAVNELLALYPN